MALSALKVFSQFSQGSATETLQQQIELFNGATKGAIVLKAASNEGDYSDATMWAKLSGLVRRRDAYGAGAVAQLDLAQLQDTSVKVAAGTPPVGIDPGMLTWINKAPKEAGVVYGRQLAVDRLADMLGVGIAAAAAALYNDGDNLFDGTAANAGLAALNSTAAKMGDKAGRIAVWVAHSKPIFDIYGEALANANRLFVFGNVRVIEDAFGRPLIMTDEPSLINPTGIGAGPDVPSYYTLGLVPGAILMEDNGDYLENIETSNGDENILRTIQSEWTYNASVRGFAWDKTNGGKSPTTAALSTGTNWDRFATSNKDLAGVLLESK
jgi:Major capsid protein 13-like